MEVFKRNKSEMTREERYELRQLHETLHLCLDFIKFSGTQAIYRVCKECRHVDFLNLTNTWKPSSYCEDDAHTWDNLEYQAKQAGYTI